MITNNKVRFIVIFVTLIISYYATLKVDAPYFEEKFNRQMSIIHNTIEHPYKYRILNFLFTQAYYTVFKIAVTEKIAFLISYAIQNVLVFLLLFFSVSKFLSLWFDDTGIIVGLLLFAVIVPLAITWWDILGDMTTAGLMALGFYFINIKKENLIIPILIVGAINEEQIILLVLFYFFGKKDNIKRKEVWMKSILYAAIFVIVYVILYMLRGGSLSTDYHTLSDRGELFYNIHNPKFVIIWAILTLPLLYYSLKNFITKPEFLRINFITVIPAFYVIVLFLIARMEEIDKALTMFLFLIPLALYTLIPTHIKKNNLEQ